jgi:hypothetical protein
MICGMCGRNWGACDTTKFRQNVVAARSVTEKIVTTTVAKFHKKVYVCIKSE